MTDRFHGKVALVTGAAQGIGRVTAERLAREGAEVVLVDRVVEVVDEVARGIVAAGGRASTVIANLETDTGASGMVAAILARHATIDVAVHNVGGSIWTKPYCEYRLDEIKREINRSLWPTLLCCHAVIPVMQKQGHGSIVNIGSTATRSILRVPYAAAKGGVAAATVALALELAEDGIRVNCVSPGAIEAKRLIPRNTEPPTAAVIKWREEVYARHLRDAPLARLGQADEVAAAICFLASDEASYITGHVLPVGGGETG